MKSGYVSYRYALLTLLFFCAQNILASSLTSNLHTSALVTMSAFTCTRKNVHSGCPRDLKCTSSTRKCLSVLAKHILGSSLMRALEGKQHIGAYVTESSFTNTRKHRKRAVVSLTKARNIFTNQTKKRNPTKPKPANSTHLDE